MNKINRYNDNDTEIHFNKISETIIKKDKDKRSELDDEISVGSISIDEWLLFYLNIFI